MNKKILIIIGIELVVCTLASISYFFMHRDMQNIVNQSKVIAFDIEKVQASHKELESLEQNIGSTKDERDRLLQVFLSSDSTVDFIDNIEVLARNIGVGFNVKTIAEREDGVLVEAGKGLVLFSVEVDGSWDEVTHFLKMLENLPYKSSVETVSVSSKVKTGEGVNLPTSFWEGVVTFSVVSTK